jgi:hypothetical protein
MKVIEIIHNKEAYEKELFLFGEYISTWHETVDNERVIIPYAIEQAVRIGQQQKADEIKKVLGIK